MQSRIELLPPILYFQYYSFLHRALSNFNLDIIPLSNPTVRHVMASPELEKAFILHLDAHWFTLRKVLEQGGVGGEGQGSSSTYSWWNFNSLNPAPELLGDVYLSAFIATMQEQGYTVMIYP